MFSGEALLSGLTEGVKTFVLMSMAFALQRLKGLALGFVFAVVLSVVFVSSGFLGTSQEFLVSFQGYIFALLYLLSLLVLYDHTGQRIFGPLPMLLTVPFVTDTLMVLFAFFYFVPDLSGVGLYIVSLSALKESLWPWFWAGIGFIVSGVLFLILRNRTRWISQYVQWPQFFLIGALIKLFSGAGTEFSLIGAVQRGLMKLNHDIVHQTFVTIMVPDHPILSVTTWNFIGFFFGRTFSLYMALALLWLPLVIFIVKYYRAPVKVPEDIGSGARRRLYIKGVKISRLKRLVPVFLVCVYVIGVWFSGKAETGQSLYNPEAKPIMVKGSWVEVPINTPEENLRDSMLHKFVVNIKGQDIRFFIFQRPDGTLVACLDACEICPPEGYAQADSFLVCLYCRTPIEFSSVGRSGGCNPIPLGANVTDRKVRISVEELLRKWLSVKTGRSREVLQ